MYPSVLHFSPNASTHDPLGPEPSSYESEEGGYEVVEE